MLKLCHCRERSVDTEHATYVIHSTPCCGRECYELAIEAAGTSIHNVVMVTYRRPHEAALHAAVG
jgi:hypothetical protein